MGLLDLQGFPLPLLQDPWWVIAIVDRFTPPDGRFVTQLRSREQLYSLSSPSLFKLWQRMSENARCCDSRLTLLWHEINGNFYQGRKWKTQGSGRHSERNRVCRCRLAWGLDSCALPAMDRVRCRSLPQSLGLSEAWELWGEVWSHNFLCSHKQSYHS